MTEFYEIIGTRTTGQSDAR